MNMNDEYRDGYFVSSKMKKIWAAEIDLLKFLLEICDKNGLKCWVLAGTMLGAVRHKGFIPWDDDMDVALPRKDFERLKQILHTEFSDKYYLQTPENDHNYFSSTIRLRNIETTGIILYTWDDLDKQNAKEGIYIDIFPMDSWPDKEIKQKSVVFSAYIYNCLFLERLGHEGSGVANRLKHKLVKMFFSVFNYEKTLDRYHRICGKYNGKYDTVAYIARGKVKNDGFRYIWTKEETAETVWLPFEDIKVPVPCGYKSCLQKRYGNYMEFPPLEARGKWHEEAIFFDPDHPCTDYAQYSVKDLLQLKE